MTTHHRSPATTLRTWILGRELRHLMTNAGHTNNTLARHLGWLPSTLSRYLNGQRHIPPADLVHLLIACGHTNRSDRDQLLALAADHHTPHHWHDHHDTGLYANTLYDLEHDCSAITHYSPMALPDILHTPEHHRALLATTPLVPADTIPARLATHRARAAILTGAAPPTVTVILTDLALHTTPQDQLRHLHTLATHPNITIHVLPHPHLAAPHLAAPFQLLHTTSRRTVLHLPLHNSHLYTEQPHTIRAYETLLAHLHPHTHPFDHHTLRVFA
ncbi:helix-turn-helix domain-containing protein [Actinokineospora diospyrosa]|uniref:Helix-turn-helix domain-containing protein n=1 Tax=Actinokineospora diospyrosa TaxID=103728 RepID=A0ABT1IE94_9PSEU|nr:helix-turn-helix transcriptional regulator [Actinokineospora diospyrosa]MCP2270861.1 Helix-turn-helix domain-containing protein [Actinokineospora diospyrosa]